MEAHKKGNYDDSFKEALLDLENPVILTWSKLNNISWARTNFKKMLLETIFNWNDDLIENFKLLWTGRRVNSVDYLSFDILLKIVMDNIDGELTFLDYFKDPVLTDLNYTLAKCLDQKPYPIITTNLVSSLEVTSLKIWIQNKIKEIINDDDFKNYTKKDDFDYQSTIFKLCWSINDKSSMQNYLNNLSDWTFSSWKQNFLTKMLQQRDLLIIWYKSFSENLLMKVLRDVKSDRKILWVGNSKWDIDEWEITLWRIRQDEPSSLVNYLVDNWFRDEDYIKLFNISNPNLSRLLEQAWELTPIPHKIPKDDIKKAELEEKKISLYFSHIENISLEDQKNLERKIYEYLDDNSFLRVTDDKPTIDDNLGRWNLIGTIKKLIIKSKKPVVLSVSGDWWVWKTSILKMLDSEIKNMSDHQKHHIVWLDATQQKLWKDENPLFPILINLYNSLKWIDKFKDKMERFQNIITSILYSTKFWFSSSIPDLSSEWKSSLAKINVNIDPWKFKNLMEEYKKEDFLARSNSYLLKQKLKEFIKSVLETQWYSHDSKMIFFIDDLDRLEWAKALEFLELIKIYFDIENCVFVLGMNERRVETAAVENYKTEDGKDFLWKIIDNSFYINVLDKINLESYVSRLLSYSNNELVMYSKEISSVLEWNPRKIIKFVNLFILSHQLAMTIDWYDPFILIYILVIQKEDIDFFRLISRDISKLESIINDLPKIVNEIENSKDLEELRGINKIYYKHIYDNEIMQKAIYKLRTKSKSDLENIGEYIHLTWKNTLSIDIVLKEKRVAMINQKQWEEYMEKWKYEESITSFWKASYIYKKFREHWNQAICLYSMWKNSWELANDSSLDNEKTSYYREKAIIYYRESLDINRKYDYELWTLVSLIKIWRGYIANWAYEESKKCFQESLEISVNRNDYKRIIQSLIWIWASCIDLKEFDESKYSLKQAHYLFLKHLPTEEKYKNLILYYLEELKKIKENNNTPKHILELDYSGSLHEPLLLDFKQDSID